GGVVCVWKADARGNMAPSVQYRRKNSAITAAVFCGGPAHSADALAQAFSPSFFFATEGGAVCYADDLGHCSEVQQLTSQVDKLMFYEASRRLVVITRSLLMTQLQVGEDGRVSQFMKVKLSVSASSVRERGLREVTWAGPGLLAAATGEGLVRFWDLSTAKNYVLTLPSGGLDRTDKSTCISFDPIRRYLAVGSAYGCVAIWKFVGDYGSAEQLSSDENQASRAARRKERWPYARMLPTRTTWSLKKLLSGQCAAPTATASSQRPNDWRALAPTTLDSVARGERHFCFNGGGYAFRETPHIVYVFRVLPGNVAIIQLSSDTLSIEYQKGGGYGGSGGVPAGAHGGMEMSTSDVTAASSSPSSVEGEQIVRCDISIKGFHLQGDSLLVHNSKQAQLVKLRGAGLAPKRSDPWPCSARSVAVDDARDQAFVAAGSRGGFKSALAFTEAEGNPILLSLCGCFLAVATDAGVIKLYDVSKRAKIDTSTLPVRPLGNAGVFKCPSTGKSLGVIRSIRCNADGTRVSILSDKVHGQALKIRFPDSRIHVYGSDKDAVESYDWGSEGRFPTAHFWDPQEPRLLAVEARRATGGNGRGGTAPLKTKPPPSDNGEEKKEGGGRGTGEAKIGGEAKYGGDSEAAAAAKSSARARAATLGDSSMCEAEVTTLFVTSDFGILMQDSFPLEEPLEALLGLQVPRLYFTAREVAVADDKMGEGVEEDHAPEGVGVLVEKGGGVAADGAGKGGKKALLARRPLLMSRAMRDFAGLDQVDEKTSAALLDFSLHLTVGDMDKAYAAVRLIKSTTVWENMAHMCVKTRRLDVAELCLGNMGHARGAAAVRLAKMEPEPEVAVAQVATQLGLLDDAVRLYRECGRYDLLNRLYQAAGLWERALEVAEAHDGINLSTTHQLYAQHLEKVVGDTAGAIQHYELAGTHCTEVPRMLFERGRVDDLEDYITQGNNVQLLKWWSQYLESRGEFEKARKTYTRAQDYLSLVRLACHGGQVDRAIGIVNESGSAPAAYHLARHLEAVGRTAEAVSFYARSCRFNHAIRLAKDHGMDSEARHTTTSRCRLSFLMGFALKSRPSLMVSVAEYLEDKGELEKAVQLYQKAGEVTRALDLCFRAGSAGSSGAGGGSPEDGNPAMFEALKSMMDDLGSHASPQVLSRCVDFFVANGQFDKAVGLCITSGKHSRAIELCVTHKVPISEEMAEELTPQSEARGDNNKQGHDTHTRNRESKPGERSAEEAKSVREDVLRELAKACKRQGNFHLACKKYTQAGDRLKALKCLLNSGDTKSIVYYAGVSRSRDIYILAANYLQNLDWHDDPQVMKSIIAFYTKAKAHLQLSDFYDACAQVEIDEYRDYEKALGALNEAVKQLTKAGSSGDKLAQLNKRVFLVERFVQARRLSKDDPDGMATMCQQLLANDELETAMRAGDVFAALVDHFFERGNWQQCYSLIGSMRDRGIVPDPYLDHGVLVRVCQEVGVPVEELDPSSARPAQATASFGDEAQDEVGEEELPMEEDVASEDEASVDGDDRGRAYK
ncbi:unnamed protein product, partial [Scytosiphon promiscuus]